MSTPVPRYAEIVTTLTEEIKSGHFAPGSRIPSEAALMRRFSCSRNTIRTSTARLKGVGLISTRRGSGSYVAMQAGIVNALNALRSISQVIRDIGLKPGMTEVSLQIEPHPRPDIETFLGGGQVWRLRRVTTASGIPFSVNDSWFLKDIADQLDVAALIEGGSLYTHFEGVAGRPVAEAVDYIGAEAAGPAEARLLKIKVDQPLLAILRYAHDDMHRPIEVSHSVVRADMYTYLVKLKRA